MAQDKHQMVLRKGTDFFEASSTFQKSIRRGDEKVALYFGTEFAGSGYAKYLWKRMLIISSEDIGLADNSVCTTINSLYNNWLIISASNHEEGIIPITHAILLLVRSQKSRLVDNAKMYCLKNGDKMEVPDYALDVHTRRGKIMGRSYKFFLESGRVLNNSIELENEEFYEEFFMKYLNDYQDKKCPITGYDSENVYLKNTKELGEFMKNKPEPTQGDLFNE